MPVEGRYWYGKGSYGQVRTLYGLPGTGIIWAAVGTGQPLRGQYEPASTNFSTAPVQSLDQPARIDLLAR